MSTTDVSTPITTVAEPITAVTPAVKADTVTETAPAAAATTTAPTPTVATPITASSTITPVPAAKAASGTVAAIPNTSTTPAAATTAATPISVAPAAPAKTTETTSAKTLREQTIAEQNDYMAYIEAVKAGTDPITNKTFNDLMKAQNASGQRTIDIMSQKLAASGQAGSGAGNAILASMARDMNVSTSELASKLSSQALERIEKFNQLGYEAATKIENDENKYVQDTTAWYLEQGNYEEAQKVYNDNAERLGLPTVDLSSPDAQKRFAQENAQYNTLLTQLNNEYENTGDYAAYVKRWNELKNTNTAFANQAGMTPPSSSALVDAKIANAKNQSVTSTVNAMNTLMDAGNKEGAKALAADLYSSKGALGSLGLDPTAMADSFQYLSTAESQAVSTQLGLLNTMAANGSTGDELAAQIQLLAKAFPDSDYVKMLASGNWAEMLASSAGASARETSSKQADKVLESYNAATFDKTVPGAVEQAKNQWQTAIKASKTQAEILAEAKASDPTLATMIDSGDPTQIQNAISEYMDRAWNIATQLTSEESVQKAATQSAFDTIKSEFGVQNMTADQETVVKAAIADYFKNTPTTSSTSIDLITGEETTTTTPVDLTGSSIMSSHPEVYLAFHDFNGNEKSSPEAQDATSYANEKSYYDTAYAAQKAAGVESLMTPQQFDSAYDALLLMDDNAAAAVLTDPKKLASLQYVGQMADAVPSVSTRDLLALIGSGSSALLPRDSSYMVDSTPAIQAYRSLDAASALALAKSSGAEIVSPSSSVLAKMDAGEGDIGLVVSSQSVGKTIIINGVPYLVRDRAIGGKIGTGTLISLSGNSPDTYSIRFDV